MKEVKIFIYYWFPVLAYCILIFMQSSMPSDRYLPAFSHMDKVYHFLGYALLGILFFRAYRTLPVGKNIFLLTTVSIISSVVYGATDEIHQAFVPHRYAGIEDFLADAVGSVGGVLGYRHFSSR